MVDIITLERDGLVYAKGIVNQEGLTFYILSGFSDLFNEAIEAKVQPGIEFSTEEVGMLPG